MKFGKTKWKLDFKNSIFIPCILVVLFIAIVLFWLPSIKYSHLFQAQAEKYNQNIIRQTNLGIMQSLFQFEKKITEVIDNPKIRSFLSSDTPAEDFQYEYQNIIENYFNIRNLDSYYLECLDIYPVNKSGHLQYGYKSPDIDQIENSVYYDYALVYPTNLNWLPVSPEGQCLELSRCIYDYNDYSLQGILVIRLSHNFLIDKFEDLSIVDTDCMYILDAQKKIICSTDLSLSGTQYPDIALLDMDSGSYSKDGKLYSYAHVHNIIQTYPYDKWISVIRLDEKDLLSDFYQILYTLNALAIVILIVSAIAIAIFSKHLTAPIYALAEAMGEVTKENFDIILPEESILKEYMIINRGFNRMTKNLDTMINTVYKAELVQKEAQLKNLQSQINPHFLFNTLQLISWKAHEYEAYPVCDMISSLSYMLQTTIRSNDENNFTLRQELEYIKQYSYIVKCKYGDKISIMIDIPDELLDCRIPKLIIQPFLENSIRHGLEPKPSPGTVSVSIQREGDDLICTIQDDGIGMSHTTLHEICEDKTFFKATDSALEGNHIALSNIRHRIHILYGKNYGFQVTSQLFGGTRTILRIPYHPCENAFDNYGKEPL